MAEATALRNNALPYPVYGAPWGIVFPIVDNDGDLVAGAAGLDSEVSKNGDTAADCTNEATEIATSTGTYYLLLTAAEMTADVVCVRVKTSTTDAKTTVIVLYPRKLVSFRTGTSAGGAAGYITLDSGASSADDYYNGCLCVATIDTLVEARVITDYTGSNKQAAVTPNWNVTPDADDTFIIYLTEGRQSSDATVSGTIDANVVQISGDATAADNAEAFFDGTGYAGGTTKLKVDLDTIKTQAVTCAAGVTVLASVGTAATSTAQTGDSYAIVNSGTYGNSATKTAVDAIKTKTDYLPSATAGQAGGVFIAGTNAATTVTTAFTTTFTGNLTGSVGSVTGAVGSVTGAVGSVTGAVGSVTGNVGGNVTGSVGSVAAGGITAASIATGAITAAKFDGSTAFPLTAADTGATAVARTGADSDTLETLSDQLDGVSVAVQALIPQSTAASSASVTYGTPTGTYSSTGTDNSVRYQVQAANPNGLDFYLEYDVGANRSLTAVRVNGYANGMSADVYAYNWDLTAWESLSNNTTRMNTRASDANYTYYLNSQHLSGSNIVRIRWASAATSGSVYIDQAVIQHTDATTVVVNVSAVTAGEVQALLQANNPTAGEAVWQVASGTLVYDVDSMADLFLAARNTIANLDTMITGGPTYAFDSDALANAPGASAATAQEVWEYASRTLSADGLDALAVTAVSGPATTVAEMIVQMWRRDHAKMDWDRGSGLVNFYDDDGTTVVMTQTWSTVGDVETMGAAEAPAP